jgi:prevent-host-death family protein
MDRVGIRELRQYASRYLARVQRGESLEVTDRGRPVALLVPVREDGWEQLVLSGRVTPPTDPADVLDEPPAEHGIDASGRLAALRDQER